MARLSTFTLKVFLALLLSIASLSVVLPVQAASETGCCIKTHANEPDKKDYADLTKEECEAVPGQTNNFFTVEFKPKLIAFNNKECRERPTLQTREVGDPIYITPTVSIPNTDFTAGKAIKVEESTKTLANYIVAIFKYSIGVIGIIAAIALMAGGMVWLTAGGNHEKISSAKTMIGSSLIGLAIAFGAFLLLSAVNTNLVNFPIRTIKKISYISMESGCCLKGISTATQTSEALTEEQCAAIPDTKFYAGLEARFNSCQSANGKYFYACLNTSDPTTTCNAFSAQPVEDRYCDGLPDPPRCSTAKTCCTVTKPSQPCGADYATCPSGQGYCKDGECQECLSLGSVCNYMFQCANQEGKCGSSSQGSRCSSQLDGVAICEYQ